MIFDKKQPETPPKDTTMDNTEDQNNAPQAMGYSGPSILSQDLKVEGKVESTGELQIDGQVYGEVTANQITVGTTGVVEGGITCESLTVLGQISGDVHCQGLTVGSPAKIHGTVRYSEIYIERGALVTAKFEMK